MNPYLKHEAFFKALYGIFTSPTFHCAPQPNCRFNADANIGHRFAILMAYVGALQPSASGAG